MAVFTVSYYPTDLCVDRILENWKEERQDSHEVDNVKRERMNSVMDYDLRCSENQMAIDLLLKVSVTIDHNLHGTLPMLLWIAGWTNDV